MEISLKQHGQSIGIGQLIDIVFTRCKTLEPYIYHRATTGSVYIKFAVDQKLGSLRIGDHKGRSKYTYKWNLRLDHTQVNKCNDRGVERAFYPANEVEQMCDDILSKYEELHLTGKERIRRIMQKHER